MTATDRELSRQRRSRRHLRAAAVWVALTVVAFVVPLFDQTFFKNAMERGWALTVLLVIAALTLVSLIFLLSAAGRIVADISNRKWRAELAFQTAIVSLGLGTLARLVVLTDGMIGYVVRRPAGLDRTVARFAQDVSTTFIAVGAAATALLVILAAAHSRKLIPQAAWASAALVTVVIGVMVSAGGTARVHINETYARMDVLAGRAGGTGAGFVIVMVAAVVLVFGTMIANLDESQMAEQSAAIKASQDAKDMAKMVRGELLFPGETEQCRWDHKSGAGILAYTTECLRVTDRRCIYVRPQSDAYQTADFSGGAVWQVTVFNRRQVSSAMGGSSGWFWANPNVAAGADLFGGGSSFGMWRGDSQMIGTLRISNSSGDRIDFEIGDPDGAKELIDQAIQAARRRFQAEMQPILEQSRQTDRRARDMAHCPQNPSTHRHMYLGNGAREWDRPGSWGSPHPLMRLADGSSAEQPQWVRCAYCGLELGSDIEVLTVQLLHGLADYRKT